MNRGFRFQEGVGPVGPPAENCRIEAEPARPGLESPDVGE